MTLDYFELIFIHLFIMSLMYIMITHSQNSRTCSSLRRAPAPANQQITRDRRLPCRLQRPSRWRRFFIATRTPSLTWRAYGARHISPSSHHSSFASFASPVAILRSWICTSYLVQSPDSASLDAMAPSVVLPPRCVVKKRRKYSTITLEKKAAILKLTESCRTQTEA
uniref:Putative secreted protein n=1 Tax=Ixodes ricinus TaxID=34613 RepID=A0A6B0UYK2_IXORI